MMMTVMHDLFWSFIATLILTTLLSSSRGLGLTRMDIPFMVGSMFTEDRDRAQWLGFIIHMLNGWVFAFLYIIGFRMSGMFHWWSGAVIGLIHALFLLTAGMALLPTIHPRMATEQHGPDLTHLLEPPGFLALHYV